MNERQQPASAEERRRSALRTDFESACERFAHVMSVSDGAARDAAVQEFARAARRADVPVQRMLVKLKDCLRKARDFAKTEAFQRLRDAMIAVALDAYYGERAKS